VVGLGRVELPSSSYKLRALPLSYRPLVALARVERASAGYQPNALPLSYRALVGAVGLEPTASRLKVERISRFCFAPLKSGGRGRSRPFGLWIFSPALLPTELPVLGDGGEDRTRSVRSLQLRAFPFGYPVISARGGAHALYAFGKSTAGNSLSKHGAIYRVRWCFAIGSRPRARTENLPLNRRAHLPLS
jgi:hypothetical protein